MPPQPVDPKIATVRVILHNDDPLDFDIESSDLPKDSNGNLVFTNNGHPGFKILFDLTDETEKGYVFPPNHKKDEAIFSKLGSSGCPTSGHQVFEPLLIPQHRQTLIVKNPNVKGCLGDFRYTLQVSLRGGPYLPLDPGGVNQNGPTSPRPAVSPIAMLLVGAAVGVAATLGTQALLLPH